MPIKQNKEENTIGIDKNNRKRAKKQPKQTVQVNEKTHTNEIETKHSENGN